MDAWSDPQHLSQIATLWSMVCQAHQGPPENMRAAREKLLQRYSGAVQRYLLGALRDQDAADDLFQEFALRFIRGDFHRADPEHGRFRNFVKTALFNLIVQHHRKRKGMPLPLPSEGFDAAASTKPPDADSEAAFLQSWREDLLTRAWTALQKAQAKSARPYYDVLRFRAANPKLSSSEMAEQLRQQLGKPLTAAGVRQTLHRARETFADLLLEEVVHSLDSPTVEQLEQELVDLELLEYCRPALERRKGSSEP